MAEQKKRKALIVYASITGNTEKVAMKFKEIIESKGPWGEWQCDSLKVTKKTDRKNIPYNIKNYDLFLIGAPIWAGIPPLYLFDDHQGALEPIMRPEIFSEIMKVPGESGKPEGHGGPGGPGFEMPDPSAGYGPKKGIVFVTYGGQGQGPIEAHAALACLELRLDGSRIKCIGKFACCGKQWDEPTVDPIAAKMNWMVGDTTAYIALYKENPNHPDFAKLTPEDRKMFEKAVKMTDKYSSGAPVGFRAWHWDFAKRPTERDLLKAEIFMKDILEDYYGGGIEMYPFSQYVSIS